MVWHLQCFHFVAFFHREYYLFRDGRELGSFISFVSDHPEFIKHIFKKSQVGWNIEVTCWDHPPPSLGQCPNFGCFYWTLPLFNLMQNAFVDTASIFFNLETERLLQS